MRALLPLLLLVACSGDYMTPKAYELAVKWCEPHGGLKWAKLSSFNNEYWNLEAYCKDGVMLDQRLRGQP